MMKKIDIKEIPLSTLIIVGILASAISFIYYFALKNPFEIFLDNMHCRFSAVYFECISHNRAI